MMEKRFILFVVLTFLVFIGFNYFFPQAQKPVPQQPVAQTEYNGEALDGTAPATSAIEGKTQSAAAEVGENEDTNVTARKIVIDGALYTAVLDNRGGVLTSWELKDYQTKRRNKNEQGRVFDMITGASMNDGLYPGALMLSDDAAAAAANSQYYKVTIDGEEKGEEGTFAPPVAVKLTLTHGDLQIEKVWSFDKDNYTANLSITGTKAGKPLEGRFFLGEDIGPMSEHFTSSAANLVSVYFSGGKVRRETPPKNPQEPKRLDGDVRWAGLDMQYFSMIAVPKHPLPWFNIQTGHLTQTGMDGSEIERNMLRVMLPFDTGGFGGGTDYTLYLGPKKQENLRRAGSADLSGVINYGMFSLLVYPLLAALRWIYQFVQNYGAAIVVLTFVISLVLFPLRLKSMLSMRKMSTVQPKIKAIQEKYRQYKVTDPRKKDMNQEIMALYKEHGVNPMGGCLPLLIQMPLLIAFYSLLAYTIDLRQAPFIWWIQDLSAKDPFYVLPIAMGLTSFISQKMMPMSPGADPTQAKVMMIMPIFFTFIFLNMSSGLNLYFLCSNVFQVALQKVAERWIPKTAPAQQSAVKAKHKK